MSGSPSEWLFYLGAGLAALTGAVVVVMLARTGPLWRPLGVWLVQLWGWLALRARTGLSSARALWPAAETWRALWAQLSGAEQQRYTQPWVGVIGVSDASKPSVFEGVAALQQAGVTPREAAPELPGGGAFALAGGVVFDLPAPGRDRGHWRRVMRRLDALRPERPLDAVLVTISAASLIVSEHDTLDARARDAFRQLWALQRQVMLSLPIYLVVTDVEAVVGLAAFWRSIGAKPDEMLGWSTPARLDVAHDDGAYRRGFHELLGRMKQLQLSGAGRGVQAADAAELLMFPRRFARLEEGVRRFCLRAFGTTAYQAGVSVRGVYFIGRLAPETPPRLLGDLLAEKVFAERHLAEAVTRPLLSRSGPLRRMQWALGGVAAFCCLGGLASALHLASQASAQMDSAQALFTLPGVQPMQCPERAALATVLGARALGEPLGSYPLLPASLFDGRPQALRAAALGHRLLQGQVFPALRCALATQAETLAGHTPTAQSAVTPLQRLDAIERWEQQRAQFEHFGQASPERAQADVGTRLLSLVQTVLVVDPTPAFGSRGAGIGAALQQVDYNVPVLADIAGQRGAMLQSLLQLARAHRDALIDEGQRGAAACGRLQRGEGDPRRDLLDVSTWAQGAGSDWLQSNAEQNPCAATARALGPRLSRLASDYRGYDVRLLEELKALYAPAACFDPIMRELDAVADGWCGKALSPQPQAPQDAEQVVETAFDRILRAVGIDLGVADSARSSRVQRLQALAEAPFLRAEQAVPFQCAQPAAWAAAEVRVARKVAQDFQRLTTQAGAEAERVLPGVRARALQRVTAHLAAAQQPADGIEDAATSSRRFAISLPDVLQLLSLLRQFDATAQDAPWLSCMRDFAFNALEALDASWVDAFALNETAAPAPDLLMDNEAAPPRPLFDGLDNEGAAAAAYASGQRVVQDLAQQAAPFVHFLDAAEELLTSTTSERPWVTTARQTLAVLRANSDAQGQLRSFYTKVLAGIDDRNCELRLTVPVSAEAEDAFSLALERVHDQALTACAAQQQVDVFARYERVASTFKRLLAGRFPFASPAARDVSVSEVETMLQLLHREQIAGLSMPMGYEAHDEFLQQLRAATELLAAHGNGKLPLGMKVQFHTGVARGIAEADILRWEVTAGPTAAVYPNGADQLQWRMGEPVSLTLRWANRSTLRPAQGRADDALEVSFTERGAWSLLRWVAAHRDTQIITPLGTVALRFRVPLRNVEVPTERKMATAQLELALSNADGTPVTALTFPREAPALEGSTR